MHNLIPNRLPEPPPSADFALDLVDGERVVGWIGPDVIGFRGFANDVEAAHAAWVAYRALSRHIAKRDGGAMLPIDAPPLEILDRPDERLVIANNRPIARLVDAARDGDDGEPSRGFELALDGPRDEVAVRAKAHLVYRALRRAGVRWALFPKPRPAAAKVTPRRTGTEDMRVGAPLPMWAAIVSVVLLIASIAIINPDLALGLGALAGIVGLIIVRLVALHRGWPPRAMPRVEGRAWPGRPAHYGTGGNHAARHS